MEVKKLPYHIALKKPKDIKEVTEFIRYPVINDTCVRCNGTRFEIVIKPEIINIFDPAAEPTLIVAHKPCKMCKL